MTGIKAQLLLLCHVKMDSLASVCERVSRGEREGGVTEIDTGIHQQQARGLPIAVTLISAELVCINYL